MRTTGEMKHTPPADQKAFKLEELQGLVGGSIEIFPTPQGNALVVNEDGRSKNLPVNLMATEIMGMAIVGDAIMCHPSFIR